MYKIKTDNINRIKALPNRYYADVLGVTEQYICSILKGKTPVKTSIAKGIISTAYYISLDDERMDELLRKHFEGNEEE